MGLILMMLLLMRKKQSDGLMIIRCTCYLQINVKPLLRLSNLLIPSLNLNFSFTEKFVAKYLGAAATKRLKKKCNITDAANTGTQAHKGRDFLVRGEMRT